MCELIENPDWVTAQEPKQENNEISTINNKDFILL